MNASVDNNEQLEEIDQNGRSVQTNDSFLLDLRTKQDVEIREKFVRLFGSAPKRRSRESKHAREAEVTGEIFYKRMNNIKSTTSIRNVNGNLEKEAIKHNLNKNELLRDKTSSVCDKNIQKSSIKDTAVESTKALRNKASHEEGSISELFKELTRTTNCKNSDLKTSNVEENSSDPISGKFETVRPLSDYDIIFGSDTKISAGKCSKWVSPRLRWLYDIEERRAIVSENVENGVSKNTNISSTGYSENAGRPPKTMEEKINQDLLASCWRS